MSITYIIRTINQTEYSHEMPSTCWEEYDLHDLIYYLKNDLFSDEFSEYEDDDKSKIEVQSLTIMLVENMLNVIICSKDYYDMPVSYMLTIENDDCEELSTPERHRRKMTSKKFFDFVLQKHKNINHDNITDNIKEYIAKDFVNVFELAKLYNKWSILDREIDEFSNYFYYNKEFEHLYDKLNEDFTETLNKFNIFKEYDDVETNIGNCSYEEGKIILDEIGEQFNDINNKKKLLMEKVNYEEYLKNDAEADHQRWLEEIKNI